MNWFNVFYWISIADNLRGVFCIFAWITMSFAIISLSVFAFVRDGDDISAPDNGLAERAKRWFWWAFPISMLCFILNAAIPSKRDALLIIAGGGAMEYFTTDSLARQLPHELTNFVVSELQVMAADAKVEIMTSNAKAAMLREAKQLTTEELLERMRLDSTFAKIILE